MKAVPQLFIGAALISAVASLVAGEIDVLESPAAPGSLAPSLTPLDPDRLILSWLEPAGNGHALKFSVLDESGFGPARTIARGEDWFANWADTPGLSVLPGGDWVAHWLVKSGPSTYAYDVVMARSSDQGRTWSEPVSPHDDGTETEHGFVSYYPAGPDQVGVVWLDGRETAAAAGGDHAAGHDSHAQAGAMTLRTAVMGSDMKGREARLLDARVCDCCQTAAAMTAEGPVVLYRDRSEDEIRDHYVVRRTDRGWSEPTVLHADGWQIGGCPVNGPALLADGERLAAAWFTMPEGEARVHLSVSSDSGRNFEQVDTLGEGTALGRVDLASTERGILLSWVDQSDRSGVLVLAEYDWRGRRLWQERIGELDAGRASGFPRIGVLGACRPVVTWTGKLDGERRIKVASLARSKACARTDRG